MTAPQATTMQLSSFNDANDCREARCDEGKSCRDCNKYLKDNLNWPWFDLSSLALRRTLQSRSQLLSMDFMFNIPVILEVGLKSARFSNWKLRHLGDIFLLM